MKARFLETAAYLFVMAMWLGVAYAQGPKPALYTVTDLGTLGGTYSVSYTINEGGLVTGGAATSDQTDGFAQTAFAWSHGQITKLGTLEGAACPSCNSEGAGSNDNGVAAILSETSVLDQNGEDFCGFGSHRQCLGAVRKNGQLTALATLAGGNNSQAYWVNKAGEVAGFSETGTYDGNCAIAYQLYRFSAVKWSSGGTPEPLRPLEGDTVSFSLGLNDNGQAVGVSGLCSNTTVPPNNVPSGPHAVLWEKDGTPVLIPSLPGALGNNVAATINNRGDVGGTQLISDGTVHGFVWNKSHGILDIAFPGAFVTVVPCCHSINNKGEVTGFAIDENGPETFLWADGQFTDLNTVLAADAPWYIVNTASINESGQIAATGVKIDTGEMHAVLLTPISAMRAATARGKTKAPLLPESIRNKFSKNR